MKKLIAITGLDGTGKSTLLKRLKEVYSEAYFATIWDLFAASENTSLFQSKEAIDKYICALTPNSRLLFLMHALRFSTDKALESEASVIILDGYLYKYLASELALGADRTLAKALYNSFPTPDLTIELKTNIATAADRKQKYSHYECGITNRKGREAFINFQNRMATEWQRWRPEKCTIINANTSPESVFKQAKSLIDAL